MLRLISFVFINSIAMLGIAQVPVETIEHVTYTTTDGALSQIGNDFLCEDFSNGFEGSTPFGAWTFEDSGANTIWMIAADDSPQGEWSIGSESITSPSVENGWVIFDADLYNTPLSPNYEDVSGYLISPEMNLQELSSVVVGFFQMYRHCCDELAPLTLEVTIDGGNEWVSFSAHGQLAYGASDRIPSTEHTEIDISCIAANQASVQIRFAFNSNSEAGYSHYFWGLDDICIHEHDTASDLVLNQVSSNNILNWWEYSLIPQELATEPNDGGLTVGCMYSNTGSLDHEDVSIVVEVLNDQMEIISSTTSILFDVPALTNPENCPAQAMDTLYISTNWTPVNESTYTIRSTISSNQFEADLANNSLEKTITYTDNIYAHDLQSTLDIELKPMLSATDGVIYSPIGFANIFHFPHGSYQDAYGIEFIPGPSSESGCFFLALLYESSAPNQASFDPNSAQVVASSEWTYDSNWNETVVTLSFDQCHPIDESKTYFAAVLEDFGSDQQLTIMANSQSDTDNSTLEYQTGINGLDRWTSGISATPAIRLIMSPCLSSVDDHNQPNVRLHQNTPNPAYGNTSINFTLDQAVNITFELIDMRGRLVKTKNMGTIDPGDHKIDFSTDNLESGLYNYRLIADQTIMTKKLIIVDN